MVCGEVLTALDTDRDDPVLRRLFPVAHASDTGVDAAYRDMVGDDLLRSRRESLEVIIATIDRTEIDRVTIEAWLTGLNSVRLVLGTRLDVGEGPLPDLEPDDPELPAWAVYEFLGAMVSLCVDALADTLPDTIDGAEGSDD